MTDYPTDTDLEPAARRLCEIRGVDPDAEVYLGLEPPRTVYGAHALVSVNHIVPQWMVFLPELRAHLEREQALRETAALKQRQEFDALWNAPITKTI